MTEDCRQLTIHTVRFVHGRGPVLYTSTPRSNEALQEQGVNGPRDKHRLVSALWNHLAAMKSPLWKRYQPANMAALPIQVVRDLLGKPHLLVGECEGPAISFSKGGGKVWAALCGGESDIGIDVTGTNEFHGEYPFHRVFHPQELQHALRLTGGDLEQASALLWSVKEAFVKALGCAFHLVDPLQITIYQSEAEDGGYTFPVNLSGEAFVRFPLATDHSLFVRSLPQRKEWLSIALLIGRAPQAPRLQGGEVHSATSTRRWAEIS
jgi:phosphopantetheinyl transferase